MNMMFVPTEWNNKPVPVQKLKDGRYIVSRNVVEVSDPDCSLYRGESAVMNEEMFSSYIGALSIETKREQDITDETILRLIEEGSL